MIRNNNANKKRMGRKPFSRTTRLVILGLISILLLVSAINTYRAYQTPTTTQQVTPLLQYTHTGQYDYTVYLKNNTIYNTTSLGPEISTYFTKLITKINASFSYAFQINQSATIAGNYSVDAVLHTNLWNKTYPLIPRTSFNEQGKTASFSVLFPLDYSYYDRILTQIDEETGVPAQNPLLLIRSSVLVFATTSNNTVSSYFTHDINVSLNQKTLDISKELTSNQPGILTKSTTINLPEVPAQRTFWTILSLVFLAGMCIVAFLTRSKTDTQSITHTELKKIKKKYGEWLVETKTHPEITNGRRIEITSLEDLAKVSEEVGKPILMYASPIPLYHRFYVLDETTIYEYMFKPKEGKNQFLTPNQNATTLGTNHLQEIKKKRNFHQLLFSDKKHQ